MHSREECPVSSLKGVVLDFLFDGSNLSSIVALGLVLAVAGLAGKIMEGLVMMAVVAGLLIYAGWLTPGDIWSGFEALLRS